MSSRVKRVRTIYSNVVQQTLSSNMAAVYSTLDAQSPWRQLSPMCKDQWIAATSVFRFSDVRRLMLITTDFLLSHEAVTRAVTLQHTLIKFVLNSTIVRYVFVPTRWYMYNIRMIELSRLNTLAKHHPVWLNTTCDSLCEGVRYILNERKTNTCFLVWRAGSVLVWLRSNEDVLHERCLSNLEAKCRRDKNKLTHKYRPQKTKQNKKCREPQMSWQACNNKRWTRLDIYS